MLTIKVGGAWLQAMGPVGDLKWSTTYTRDGGGGSLAASWSMFLPRGFTHPALRQGALVELMVGPHRVWVGTMSEPDRDEWTFTADGLFRQGERYVAVDSAGVPSTDLSVIIPEAISNTNRLLPWKDPGDLPTGPVSSASSDAANLNTITAVLNRYCDVNGKRWRIDNAGYLRIVTDPTAPTWAVAPGTPAMATADDDYASAKYGRYVSAVSGTPPEPSGWSTKVSRDTAAGKRWGVREEIEDLTDLGLLTGTAAQAITDARLASGTARPAFVEGIEVTADQVTTLGGTRAFLPFVQAAKMVRHHGVLDSDGGIAFGKTLDWIIGGTEYAANSSTITLTPMGLAPRTVAAVAQSQKAAEVFK